MRIKLNTAKRRILIGIHDLVMTAVAVAAAFWLRLSDDLVPGTQFFDDMLVAVVITVPMALTTYQICGLYKGIWRYASVQDLLNIVRAATILTVLLVGIDFFARGHVVIPRSVVILFWFVLIVLLGAPRMMYRVFREYLHVRKTSGQPGVTPVLAVGTGPETDLLLRTIESARRPTMRVVGILAQRNSDLGQTLRGVPVIGLTKDIDMVVAGLRSKGIKPRRLVLSHQALSREGDLEALMAAARRNNITPSRLSNATLTGGDPQGGLRLSPVRIEDMLMRPSAELDMAAIRTLISGRNVLVTGGGGSIGSEICKQVAAIGAKRLTIVENSELALYQIERQLEGISEELQVTGLIGDVRDRDSIHAIFEEIRPELVFHAAALKHVPIVETNRMAGALTNIIGTQVVADAAYEFGADTMVLISTDKAIRPTSFMGASKRAAELYCQALDAGAAGARNRPAGAPATRFVSVRFGNVLASTGSVLWVFQEQIERGGPVTITHPDMQRYFMTVREATSLVLMASADASARRDTNVSVYVLDMGEPVKIVDLAHRMIRLAGFEPEVDIPIAYTGIRPGERLHEALFHQEEAIADINISGVFASRPRSEPISRLRKQFSELEEAIERRDDQTVVALVRLLVPEYVGEEAGGEIEAETAGIDAAQRKVVYLKDAGRS